MNEVFTNEPTLIILAGLIAFLFIIVMFLFICGTSSNVNSEEFVKDSIFTAKLNNKVSARYSKLFNVEKDEFSDYTWLKPKDAPKYLDENGVYCYFSVKNDRVTSDFRFVYQHCVKDSLFLRYMIFNIDGENITIKPNMEIEYIKPNDYGYGGKIWEWCDQSVNNNNNNNINGINENFIKKIANAKSVKVKMVGERSYKYEIRTLSSYQIKSIKNTYECYLALGGRFY